jgi:hypothetical protein
MVKKEIIVEFMYLDEGTFLYNPKTTALYSYPSPKSNNVPIKIGYLKIVNNSLEICKLK